MELLAGFFSNQIAQYAAIAIASLFGGSILGWLLKFIPMDKFQEKFGKFMRGFGVVCTAGLSKWKYTKRFWNATLEPFFIHFIRDVLIFGINEFIKGLESDNIKPDKSDTNKKIPSQG